MRRVHMTLVGAALILVFTASAATAQNVELYSREPVSGGVLLANGEKVELIASFTNSHYKEPPEECVEIAGGKLVKNREPTVRLTFLSWQNSCGNKWTVLNGEITKVTLKPGGTQNVTFSTVPFRFKAAWGGCRIYEQWPSKTTLKGRALINSAGERLVMGVPWVGEEECPFEEPPVGLHIEGFLHVPGETGDVWAKEG